MTRTDTREREREREGGHEKRKAEMGVMWPQAKKHLGPLEAEEAREGPPLWALGAGWP